MKNTREKILMKKTKNMNWGDTGSYILITMKMSSKCKKKFKNK